MGLPFCFQLSRRCLVFGLQPAHIVVIILIALIFFAPSRLPSVARGMKTMVSEFRKGLNEKNKDRESD